MEQKFNPEQFNNSPQEKAVALVNLGDGRKYAQIDEGLGLASAGLEWIASYLEKNGFQTKIIDQSMHGLSEDEVVKEVLESKADIIGFNPLSNSRESFQKIIDRVKSEYPTVISVIGGYDATFKSLADYREVNLLVRGRGEKAMLKIVRHIRNQQEVKDIPGVAYKTKDGVIDNIDQRAEALNLEDLPMPISQNIDYLVRSGEPRSTIASLGCRWSCDFCSTPSMYRNGRQERPLKSVLDEIDYYANAGVKKFSFYDEDFFDLTKESMERADQIIQRIKEHQARITFVFITPAGINVAQKLGYLPKWEGAIERLYVGIEGGCKHAIEAVGKKGTREALNEKVINIVRQHNVELQIGFMMFNPHSTFEELEASAQFLQRTDEAVNMMSFCHHLRPYPGTPIYDKLRGENLLIEAEADAEIDRYADLPYHFQSDLESGTDIKSMATALGRLSAHDYVSESDRLNNEIYMDIVHLGYGKEIFIEEESEHEIVRRYKPIREKISDLNFKFFMQYLDKTRDRRRIRPCPFVAITEQTFAELQEEYLSKLSTYLPELREIKKEVL